MSHNRFSRLFVASLVGCLAALGGGCASTEQAATPEILPNPALDQAVQDLEEARQLGAVWMVRDPVFDNRLVSLDEMLVRARLLNDRQQGDAASALATRVSHFARLGIAQASAWAAAGPDYPQ